MMKVLVAVDDSRGSVKAVEAFLRVFSCAPPDEVVLLHTEKIEGLSLMDEMLGEAELSTLREELKGTVHQEKLDKKAKAVLGYFNRTLAGNGIKNVKCLIREGHPADEILSAAQDEGAGMIVVGSRGKRLHTLLMGSVSREVANRADIPVLIAK